ncbi:hypothetical protein [Synechococcus phage MA10]
MSFSMSGGGFSYNRFEAFEKQLKEGSCTKGYQEGGEVKACDHCDGKGCDKCDKDCKECGGKGCDKCGTKKKGAKGAKPDYLDMDKDGNKEEPMKDAIKDAETVSEAAIAPMVAGAVKALGAGLGKAGAMGAKAAGSAAKGAAAGAKDAAKGAAIDAVKGVGKKAKSLGQELVGQKSDAIEVDQEEVEEGYKPTPFEKMERQSGKAYKKEQDAVRKGDEDEANKQMKRRAAMKSPLARQTELINQGKGRANEMTRKSKLTKESLEAVGIFTEEEIEVILERLDEMPAGDVGHEIHKKAMKANQSTIDAVNKPKEKKEKAARSKSMKEAYADMYMEVYKGKHGQSDKEYADSRSEGGKMISGDSKQSGAEYTHGRRVKAANPGMQPDVGGKTKPKSQGKMDKGTRADLEYRKANLKKEEVELEEGLFGKKMTDEEKAAKKRNKVADELERLHKHVNNPLSDVNTSKGLRKKMKEELEATGLFSESEIEALVERNAEVEAQGKKVAKLEKEGRAKGLTDKFRQEHPGSREEKKERGAKKSVGDVQADQREFHNKLQGKYGRTEKQKKEASIMSKHTSARD